MQHSFFFSSDQEIRSMQKKGIHKTSVQIWHYFKNDSDQLRVTSRQKSPTNNYFLLK